MNERDKNNSKMKEVSVTSGIISDCLCISNWIPKNRSEKRGSGKILREKKNGTFSPKCSNTPRIQKAHRTQIRRNIKKITLKLIPENQGWHTEK